MTYANLATAAGAGHDAGMLNRYRVTSQAQTDGQRNTATLTYSYGTPQVNALGTNLQPDSAVLHVYPNSATLSYNTYLATGINQAGWLAHQALTEFRSHSWMQETDPSGAKVKHWFYQGDVGCAPTVQDTTHALMVANPCFQQLRDRELLKGREYLTEVFTSGGSKLTETSHAFTVGPVDYSYAPLAGLWRAFRYESQVSERMLEGGTTPSTRTTKY